MAYAAPPRSGYPQKSALPDGVDEVTAWQLVSAYLKGEIENLPSAETKAPRPTAQQITRAEMILELWHHVALMEKGDRDRLKKAIYLKASGMRPRAIRDRLGLNYQQLWNAQKQACSDIWEKISQLSQLGGVIKREIILRFSLRLEILCSDQSYLSVFYCSIHDLDTHWVVSLCGGC